MTKQDWERAGFDTTFIDAKPTTDNVAALRAKIEQAKRDPRVLATAAALRGKQT